MPSSTSSDTHRVRGNLWPHQRDELVHHSRQRKRALFWSMRTGKTRPVLEMGSAAMCSGRADIMVVVCSKSAITGRVWSSQAQQFLVRPPDVWEWDSASMARKWGEFEQWLGGYHPNGLMVVINREALLTKAGRRFIALLKARFRKPFMVSDEHHRLRSAGKTWVLMLDMFRGAAFVRLLSGTPLTNNPSGTWHQMRFLDPRPFGAGDIWRFRDMHVRMRQQATPRGYVQVEDGLADPEDFLRRIEAYGSVLKREDCPWLPEMHHEWMPVGATPPPQEISDLLLQEELRLRNLAKSSGVHEDFNTIYSLQAQVANGFLYASDRWPLWEHDGPVEKTRRVADAVQDAGGQTVVFCRFVKELERVASHLRRCGVSCATVHGGQTGHRRAGELDLFTGGERQCLVAAAGTIQDSVDLGCADAILWHSPVEDGTVYEQSSARHAARGSALVQTFFTQDSPEASIVTSLKGHMKLRGRLNTNAL